MRHYRGKCFGYLSLEVLRHVENAHISLSATNMVIKLDSRKFSIPLDQYGQVLLDWLKVRDFDRIPFAAVVQIAEMRKAACDNLCQEALAIRGFSSSLLEARRKLAETSNTCTSSENPGRFRKDILQQRGICMQETEALLSLLESLVSRAKSRGLSEETRRQVAEFERLASTSRKLLDRADYLLGKLREKVEGRICIVGSTHTGSTDLHPTPVATEIPGCMAHSSLISMFHSNSFPRIPWSYSSHMLLVICGLLITFASSRLSALHSVLIAVAALAGMVSLMFVLFASTGLYFGVAGPFIGIVASFAGTAAYRRFTEESAKRRIRSIFQRQVGEAMAEQLLSHGEEVRLGGEMRNATVYFSDVAGFSAISEKLTPPELVELLNEYYTVMCEPVVEIYGGYLDKFEGDAILAVFGIPLEGENHARDACYAAIENQKALAALREKLTKDGKPEIHQRIGLSTGEMVVGYIGSPQRHDYTVLGDAVNLGQRLEGASKLYGTSIIISEATLEMARDFVEVRELDLARVPGRAQPVKLYELVSKKGELPEEKSRAFNLFAEALELYRNRSFNDAKEKFREVLDLVADDGPSRLYVKRCEQHISLPPPDDWDGVHEIGLK
jgi:adenylate cyclase